MKWIVLMPFFIFTVISVSGQTENVHYEIVAGTGIAMSRPEATPFLFRVSAQYPLWKRFSVGVGTGVSVYDKIALIPICGDVRFRLTRMMKFTPYLGCTAGYSFAPAKNANGGFHLAPSVGVLWNVFSKLGFSLSAGYEFQKLERLKEYSGSYFATQFKEVLNHRTLVIKAGILF